MISRRESIQQLFGAALGWFGLGITKQKAKQPLLDILNQFTFIDLDTSNIFCNFNMNVKYDNAPNSGEPTSVEVQPIYFTFEKGKFKYPIFGKKLSCPFILYQNEEDLVNSLTSLLEYAKKEGFYHKCRALLIRKYNRYASVILAPYDMPEQKTFITTG